MSTTISTSEILNIGMECLKEKLGVVDAERFISVVLREQFDYTKWQQMYFEGMTSEQFNDGSVKYSEEHPHKGNAKVII